MREAVTGMVNECSDEHHTPCGRRPLPCPTGLRVTRNGQGESLGSRHAQGLPEDLRTRIAVIQALIPLGVEAVEDALKEEVERLAGPRYGRHLRTPGHVRWSKERGAVYRLDQKVPIASTLCFRHKKHIPASTLTSRGA